MFNSVAVLPGPGGLTSSRDKLLTRAKWSGVFGANEGDLKALDKLFEVD